MTVPPATPIGIVVALPVEARVFGVPPRRNRMVEIGSDALLYVAGVGTENARLATREMLSRPLAGIVSWGTAGALAPHLPAGALLLPRVVLCADAAYETDAPWRQRLDEHLAPAMRAYDGPMYSIGAIVTAAAEKRQLHADTGAIAADVETGVIAELALDAHVPFVCIRAVLDTADTELPGVAVDGLDEQGFPAPARIVTSLITQPRQLGQLPGLARQLRAARATLAAIVRGAGPRLLGP